MGRLEGELDNFDCQPDSDLRLAIDDIVEQIESLPIAIVPAALRVQCEANGFTFDLDKVACNLPPAGLSSFAPASNCVDLLSETHGRVDRPYHLQFRDGNTREIYCDQTT